MAKSKIGRGALRGGTIIWAGITILLILVFIGSLTLLRSVYETETYYVLNQNVPTRTAIVFDTCDADGNCGMLKRVVTSAGTGPIGAPGMSKEERMAEQESLMTAISAGDVYSRFPLVAGDVLSPSNVDVGLGGITSGIPDDWVTTNISVGADDAVGGRIQRGTYFDILVVNDSGAYYPFVNVLALDTSVDLASASSADAAETEEAKAGQTTQYVVGMSPENAAKLQYVMRIESGNVKLVLSPQENEYTAPNVRAYEGIFSFDPSSGEVIAPGLRRLSVIDADGQTCEVYREVTRNDFAEITDEPVEGVGNARNPEGFSCASPNTVTPPEDTSDEDDSDEAVTNEEETPEDEATPSPEPTDEETVE